MRALLRRISKGQKMLIAAACFALLMLILLGIWRSGLGSVQGKAVKNSGKQKAAQKESAGGSSGQKDSNAASSDKQPEESQAQKEVSVPSAAPDPQPKIPTISKPRGLIVVESPQNGGVVIASKFVLSGKADVIDDTLFYEVEDAQGQQWIAGTIHAGGDGNFSITIDLVNCKYLSTTAGGPHCLSIRVHSDLSRQAETVTVNLTIVS
jgi:hypothetical protein